MKRTGWIGRGFALAALAALAMLSGCASHERAEPKLTAEQVAQNVASFDMAWERIRDKHFDEKLGGVDWVAAREELRPKVEQAETMSAAREAISELIARLGLTHFGVIPAELTSDMGADAPEAGAEKSDAAKKEASEDAERGVPGIDTRVFGDELLVIEVTPGSPAERAGIRPGWKIVKIAGVDVQPTIERLRESVTGLDRLEMSAHGLFQRRLSRPVGESARVAFLDQKDQFVELDVESVEPQGVVARLGNLPPFHIVLEERELPGGIAYVRLNAWFAPAKIMPHLEQIMRARKSAPGIVFDLRGNPGGIGAMSMGAAGWFVRESKYDLGTMKTRKDALRFVVNPRPAAYEGPLAILIDGCTGSTSEIFVGGMQDMQRARLFGRRTAGAALPSVVEKLPNGDGLQYAFADFIRPNGKRLEGVGVEPDVSITPTRAQLLAGQDPVLDAAVTWLRSAPKPAVRAARAVN